ncbi:MAG: hypothetical protein FD177_2232 [Desulfovibrionaceae bacterium]|nr:MAG: hypothetical protein FD177_2232 [Desulfovibrionaceae bacterium]
MRHALVTLALALITCLAAIVPAQGLASDILRGTVELKAVSGKTIPLMLIGTNLHVWNELDIDKKPRQNHMLKMGQGMTPQLNQALLARCREMSLHILRFPGGNTSDHYHWRFGVGPLGRRVNNTDEFGRKFRNFFGTLEFEAVAGVLNTEKIITVNYKSGTPQEAANWVEYCNVSAPLAQPNWTETAFQGGDAAPAGYFAWLRAQHGLKKPMQVKYWEVGNEINMLRDKNYLPKAVEYSKAMKARDPSIKVGLVGDSFLYMNEQQIRALDIQAKHFDFLVMHYYSNVDTLKPMTRFWSNAESTRTFDWPADGPCDITIEARGDKALEWPLMQVIVNGALTQQISVSSASLAPFTSRATLRKGQNTITLKYVNDRSLPGIGDCNLFVKSVWVAGAGRKVVDVWQSPELEYNWLFANNRLIEEHIALLRKIFPDLPIAVTESNTGYGVSTEAQADANESRKLKAALWMASHMNALVRKEVLLFTHWVLYGGGVMGFALVYPDGHLSPTFYVLQMYAVHAGRARVELSIGSPTFDTSLLQTTPFGKATSGNPYLDGIASYDPVGKELALTLVNRHPKAAIATRIAVGRFKAAGGVATLEVLNAKNADGMEADNEKDPGNVAVRVKKISLKDNTEVTLEPHSITTIRYGGQ